MNGIVRVALAPPDLVDASLAKEVAAIINRDLYGTRLLLTRKVPTLIARYQTIQERSLWETIDALGKEFNLTDQEQRQLLPSGQQRVFYNGIGWPRTYMKQAGLLESTCRGYFHISKRCLAVLSEKLSKFDDSYLEQFAEFRQFKQHRREKSTLPPVSPEMRMNML